MYIIAIEPIENNLHVIESQSHRTSVWMDGYIEVPPKLVEDVVATGGYCKLVIEDGALVDVIATEKPVVPDPEPADVEPSEEDDTAAMLVDHEYRLTLLELGLTE